MSEFFCGGEDLRLLELLKGGRRGILRNPDLRFLYEAPTSSEKDTPGSNEPSQTVWGARETKLRPFLLNREKLSLIPIFFCIQKISK